MNGINSEIKKEILDKVKSGKTVKEVSKQYGVSDRTIYAWLKRGVANTVSALEMGKIKKENQILKEIVGALTIELEKLKKKRN